MEPLLATSALFLRVPDGVFPQWRVRLLVSGSGFLDIGTNLRAKVGDQEVEAVMVDSGGAGFTGFLPAEPPEGARLSVGYGRPLVATGVTYHGPLHDPIPLVEEGPVA
ncbi:hypothetical protein ACFFMN_03520 [Planobispora siamensis]|uniref:Uncharacterized protein n=1 Tax=Planobispora siamensis TaxID=936338 RepID=A0A8J3SS77_9ACTN|nr:hypothetical protein [Planobispora siamensis]GIH97750.1 hypothetical protein Psi01_83800 [Planobispora siamensis]